MSKRNKPDWQSPRLEGVTFAFVGKEFRSIQEAIQFVTSEGAAVVDDITSDVDYLVFPDRGQVPSPARKKVQRLNRQGAAIQEITPGEIVKTLNLSREDTLAMLQGGKKGLERFCALIGVCDTLRSEDVEVDFKVDLTGVNLREASIPCANLTRVLLDGADLRGADLRGSELPELRDTRLDGANLQKCQLPALIHCSLDKAKLNRASLGRIIGHGRIEASSFQRADMAGVRASFLTVRNASFSGAILKKADLRRFDARGCDFSNVALDDAFLVAVDLSDANLKGASLRRANLGKARLCAADLSGADLRGGYLVGADLTNCRVNDADFRRANLFGACVDGVDVARARGLGHVPQFTGGAGPCLTRLEELANHGARITTSIKLQLPRDHVVELLLTAAPSGKTSAATLHTGRAKPPHIRSESYFSKSGAGQALLEMAADMGWGKLDHATVTASAEDCPMAGEPLRQLALSAWCEAFGEPPPATEEVQAADARREQRLRDLQEGLLDDVRSRGSAVGDAASRAEAQSLNERIRALRSELGRDRQLHWDNVDLAGANLTGLDLFEANLEGATLRNADARAYLGHANLRNADLARAKLSNLAHADLTGANLERAQLTGAVLLGTKLDNASLRNSDIRGADLRHAALKGVQWKQAVFDGKTRFPVGFVIPADLVWAGKGADPRTKQRRKAEPGQARRRRKSAERPQATPARAKRKQPPTTLTAGSLLSDSELAELSAGVQDDAALPDGVSVELLEHPVYGADLAFSLCLEYCQHRFELSEAELLLNLWYRCERFVRLYDAIEGGYSDGDHDRADKLLEHSVLSSLCEDEFLRIHERVEREVKETLARSIRGGGTPSV